MRVSDRPAFAVVFVAAFLIPRPARSQSPLPLRPPTMTNWVDPYILDTAEMRAELKVDAKQAIALNALNRKATIDIALATTGKPEGQPAIDAIVVRWAGDQRALLRPEQRERLEQIRVHRLGTSAFYDPAIQKRLGLSADQKARIKPIIETLDYSIAGSDRRATEAAMALLTEDQKRTWKEILGKPYAIASPIPDLDPNGRAAPGMKRPQNPRPAPPRGADPSAPPTNPFDVERMRFPEDYLPANMRITMLDDPLVQADLKFDATQVQAARAITARYFAPFRQGNDALQAIAPSERRAKMREIDANQSKALMPEVGRLLTPAQSRRADQILRWKAIPSALLSPRVQRQLKLDETQRKAAIALSEESTRASLSSVQEGKRGAALLAAVESVRREVTPKFIRLLTPDQKALWDEMMGPPFAMSDPLPAKLPPPRLPGFDPDKAIAEATEALRTNPNDASAYRNRGRAWSLKREYDKAIADYTEAIRLDPTNTISHTSRALVWPFKKEYDKAIADFTEAIRLEPNKALWYVGRGHWRHVTQDYDGAIADYTEAIRLEPKFSPAYTERGAAWSEKHDYDKAIADYDEAIRQSPRSAKAHVLRGDALRSKNQTDRANDDYDMAIALCTEEIKRLPPVRVYNYLVRGDAWRSKREFDKAIADYDEAIRLDPQNEEAASHRAGVLLDRQEREKPTR